MMKHIFRKKYLLKIRNPLKSISDDAQTQPGGNGMNLGKSQNLEFLRSGPSMISMDAICMLWRHGMWCMDMADVFLCEKNMSSCWRRLYGHGRCLLVGEEHVLLLEKTIWQWKMSSCWRRIYGYGRYLFVSYLILLVSHPVCVALQTLTCAIKEFEDED